MRFLSYRDAVGGKQKKRKLRVSTSGPLYKVRACGGSLQPPTGQLWNLWVYSKNAGQAAELLGKRSISNLSAVKLRC